MRIIDAFTGRDVQRGEPLTDPYGRTWTLQDVEQHGLFRADAIILFDGDQAPTRVPLVVRFMHPKAPFRRIAFVPT